MFQTGASEFWDRHGVHEFSRIEQLVDPVIATTPGGF